MLFVIVVVIAFLLGAVAGLDSPVMLTLLAGPVLVMLMFFMVNAQGMLVALFIVTFLIQGSALYFLNLRQATWIAVGMAVLFSARIVMDQTVARRRLEKANAPGTVMVWLGLFAACYGVSLILNRPAVGQVVASLKSIWPMFGVLVAFYWVRWAPEQLRRLWMLMIIVLLAQLPVTLYQHFFVASKIFGAFDSVVGTFGGTQLGGGLSSVMVLFVIIALCFVLALWNRGLMTQRRMLTITVIALMVILLGEVKAAFIWLPVAAFFVLRKRVLRSIASLVTYGVLAAALCGAIYFTYNQLYWGGNMSRLDTVEEKLDSGGGYFFDPNNVNYTNGEISRGASLALWATDRVSSPLKRAMGYGPGASKSGSVLGNGEIARRFAPLHIDATTLAVLLWEVGVLGALAYAGMIFAALRAGWRFIKAGQGSTFQLAAMETAVAGVGLCVTMLIYNRTLTDEPTMQLLFVFCMGYIVQCVRFGPHAAEPGDAAAAVVAAAPPRKHGVRLRPGS